MSFNLLYGSRTSGDRFWNYFSTLDGSRYIAQCRTCGRTVYYHSPAVFHRGNIHSQSNIRFRASPATMPHPTNGSGNTRNNTIHPSNQSIINAAYQPYPRIAVSTPSIIRAPNPISANLGYLSPGGTRYSLYYHSTPPDPQIHIQIHIPNTDDPLMMNDPVVREISPDQSQDESSDATEETEEFPRETCDLRLRKWIITGGHPFSMIATKEFTEFMNEVNPSYTLPTVDVMRSDLRADYLKFSEMMHLKLLDPVSICITAESLISKNNCHYLAMTAHYIDKQFEKRALLFDCCEMLRYDRTALLSVIDMTLAKFNLTGRVTTFVSDNKVLVKQMFADSHNWVYFECYGWELKEIADGLKQVAIKFFADYCPTVRIGPDSYLQDVIEVVMKVLPTLANSIEEYNMCVEIIKVLKPFEELILFVGNKYICTSEFILINRSLVSAYEKLVKENFSENIKEAIVTVLEKLAKLVDNECIPSLAYATFLDPRYKNTVCRNPDEELSIKETFIEEVTALCRPKRIMPLENNGEMPADPEIVSIFNAFDKKIEESQVPVRTATNEVNRYVNTTPVPRHEDPLKWWADNAHQFPHLAKMAVTHLNMQITSVPLDQIFTNAGKIVKEKRNNYDTEMLPLVTFLSANTQYMDGILNDL